PDADNIRYCSAAPAAAPAGTTRLKAFDATCDREIANHLLDRSANASSHHTQAKLAASARMDTPIHQPLRCASRGQAESISPRLGANRYKTTRAAVSPSPRRMIRPRRAATSLGEETSTERDGSDHTRRATGRRP